MAKVLIVDDSPSILARLSDSIAKVLKYEVVQAESFEEARNRINSHKDIDIALLDLGLPDAKDEEIVQYVQKFNIPIVVLSGSDNAKVKELMANTGIVEYIIKDRSYAVEYAVNIVQRFIKNKNTHVLVVDDSKTFCEKVAYICRQYNLIVSTASSGKEALEILKANSDIKLVFVDYIMPNMNGLELTTEIRKLHSKDILSVIALSGSDEKDIVAKFLKYGANDFISKDFSNEELLARLNVSLDTLELFELTKQQANKDFLTGLYNRRYFFEHCNRLYLSAKDNNKKISIAMLDIDYFKRLNDTYGHEVGDLALKHISKLLQNELRGDIIISRFGGEEFAIFFNGYDEIEALKALETFRKVVQNSFIKTENQKISFTISGGICSMLGDNIDSMLKNADKGLYKSKENGRNQINIYQGES